MVDTSSGRRAKPFNLLWDEWEATKQPVQERANILPFGTYADGSTHLAFPGLLAMPFEGFARGQALSGHDIAANPEIGIPAAVDVAGGAMTGGFAATAAGAGERGALMANGMAKDASRTVSSHPVPEQFRGRAPESPIQKGARDDTGAWFLEGDKPVYTNATRESLDLLFGPEYASQFDQYPSIKTWMPSQGKMYPHTTWYKPNELERAQEASRIAQENKPKSKDHHRRYGLAVGYPEDSVEAWLAKRDDLYSNSNPSTALGLGLSEEDASQDALLINLLRMYQK